jgi:poly(3-hydroxybutyrate) depolymerase
LGTSKPLRRSIRFDRLEGSRRTARRVSCILVLLACALAAGMSPAHAGPGGALATPETRSVDLPRQQVLLRTLQSDPQQEYFLYVPSRGAVDARIFVAVHGTSRNAEEHARLFSPFAERYGVVLVAPYFPEKVFDDYQRLGRSGRGRRSDLALDAIVDEVADLTGARNKNIYLFGFSGGAQFAHRYTMAHPDHVARAAVASAGWYTFPDPGTTYPYGIRPDGKLNGVVFDPEQFLRVPIAVFVGEADTTSHNMRQNEQVDRQQGLTRLERARNWAAAMRKAAAELALEPRIEYTQVPRIHHSFRQFMEEGDLGPRVFTALFGTQTDERTGEPAAEGSDKRHGALGPQFVPSCDDAVVTVGVGSW